MKWHIDHADARKSLNESAAAFVELMRHGTMSVELFAPRGKDTQAPHAQDELYIITSGTAQFCKEDSLVACRTGDVLFVEAGKWHRFQQMSDDFETLVVFYGQAQSKP